MKKKTTKAVSAVYMVLVYTFLFVPIIAVMVGSVNVNSHNYSFDGFTVEWYQTLLENDSLLEGLKNTILLAISSTILSIIIGTLSAFGMYRFKFKGKGLLDMMFYIPIVIPEIVLGISLMVNKIGTFLHITLPLIMPGITSGAFMAFTLSIDDVIISYFTSGPGSQTLPIVVYNMTRRRITPDVYALSSIIIVIVLLVSILSQINFKKIFSKVSTAKKQ